MIATVVGLVSVPMLSRAADVGRNANGDCVNLCQVSAIRTLHTSTGYEYDLFETANTSPALVVEYDGSRCYADLVRGEGDGINIIYDEITYHTRAPGKCMDAVFYFVPETDGATFNFKISASGTFYVNWGDGDVMEIDKQNTTETTYSHTYEDGLGASGHTIGLGGVATGYKNGGGTSATSAISFYRNSSDVTYKVKSIGGCLTCVFPVISVDSKQYPSFNETFRTNTALTDIPNTLFTNVTVVGDYMFDKMFYGSGVTSLPDNLFAGITEATTGLFTQAFRECSSLRTIGNILPDLVGPEKLPNYVFYNTFTKNTSLENTLRVGPDGLELWDMWPSASSMGTYTSDTQLPNYSDIPTRWR